MVIVFLVVNAAVLGLWTVRFFTYEPRSDEEPCETLVLPDGQGHVLNYLIFRSGGAGGSTRGVALVQSVDGGSRVVYYGQPAEVELRGGLLLFTEQESRDEHLVDPARGSYDHRFDDRSNLYGTLAMMMVPGVLVVVLGAGYVRRARADGGALGGGTERPDVPADRQARERV